MIELTKNQFWENRTWDTKISLFDLPKPPGPEMIHLFDQNGYRLTRLEQFYADSNGQPYAFHGYERALRKEWMVSDPVHSGPHLNHAFLFERKGYSDEALEQLQEFSKENNQVYKLINYRGKWGVDFSMDYVDETGNSMEIVHFEYDSYNLSEIQEVKAKVEEEMLKVDWHFATKNVLDRKSEWIELEFFEQSKWKTDYFGLPAERFKMNAWE
jgi:hypothetical protein